MSELPPSWTDWIARAEAVDMLAVATFATSRREAKERGLKHYFTGVPCRHGHVAPRTTKDKMCVKCHRIKSSAAYYAHHEENKERARKRYRSLFPLDPAKEQKREECRDREEARKRAALERQSRPRKTEKQKSHDAYWRNHEHQKALRRKYYAEALAKDPEKIRDNRRRNYIEHRAERLAAAQRWREDNKAKRLAAHHRRRARKKGSGGSYSSDDVAIMRKAQKDRCAYCRTKLGGKGHIDHIIALAKGGTNDKANIQLTCDACNMRKSARDPIEFAQSIGRLL